jgi:hypothetical protein
VREGFPDFAVESSARLSVLTVNRRCHFVQSFPKRTAAGGGDDMAITANSEREHFASQFRE